MAADLKPGTVVLNEQFGSAAAQGKWDHPVWAKIVTEGANGRPCLRVDVPAGNSTPIGASVEKDVNGIPIKLQAGRYETSRHLDLTQLRGWKIKIIANLRTSKVPVPEVPWEGIRLGININTPFTEYNYNANGLKGSDKWSDVELSDVRIPDDATSADLYLGLISTTGTLWAQSVEIILAEPPFADLAKKRAPFVSQTQWRGAGLGGGGAWGVKNLAEEWHGNVGKWWIELPSPDLSEAEAAPLLEAQLAKLDKGLAEAHIVGVKIIVQLGTYGPGDKWLNAKLGGTHRYFLEKKAEDRVLNAWKLISSRYSGNPAIMGYDVLNEPALRVPPAPDCDNWEGLAQKAALIINKHDPSANVYVQAEEWWGVNAFQKMRPIHAKHVIYSVHMYAPFEVTSQGISDRKSLGMAYPGVINGVAWNKDTLRQALEPAREFQMAYGVPMQVGEFSCIRWAPNDSEGQWLKDVTDIFEEYGWDWTYHAFNEWDGWNPEFGADPNNTQVLPNPPLAKTVLLNVMAKNKPPYPNLPIER